jgi:hypothetical protein
MARAATARKAAVGGFTLPKPRARRALRTTINPETGLPDTMDFFVVNFMERSGVMFVPPDSHVRDSQTGLAPERVPSNGYCPTRLRENMPPEISDRNVETIQEGTVRIRIVAEATGHPLEMTPHELYEAICPANRQAKGALAPVQPLDPYYKRLLDVGRRSSGAAVVRMIKPSGPNPITRRYEPGQVPNTLTAEGLRNAAQAAAALRSGNPENPMVGSGFMEGWRPPSDAPVMTPEQLNARYAR